LAHPDFLAAISAMGIEDLFTEGNKLQPRNHSNEILRDLKKLTASRKPVLLIEYSKTPERRAISRNRAKEISAIWLITDRQLKTLGESGH
jgi:endo-alpha-1,4-polygalactosaminidase (GH114 family)